MKLDTAQKDEFISYWGRTAMTFRGQFAVPETAEKTAGGKHKVTYYRYYVHGEDNFGNPRVMTELLNTYDIEEFEPWFPESQFYQVQPTYAFWLTRRPERSRRKGFCGENAEMLGIAHIYEKAKEVITFRSDFSMKDIARMYHKILPKYEGTVQENFAKYATNPPRGTGYSLALSKNVAAVSSDFEIPVIFYKMNPVGYLVDNKVLVNSKKMASIETIKEETNLNVETY